MKIKRLRIQNFQSIKDITFNFSENGVFYFNGDNNIGKSSVLKAIRALFFNVNNISYHDYIRDDEMFFSIAMEDFDGNFVVLSRGASDFYKWNINGESGELHKTSGKVPAVLTDYFKLYRDDKNKECANIRPPRAVLLGVDTSEGDNNLFLQEALRSSGFTKGYKQADTDKRTKAKELKLIENYIERTEKDIENMDVDVLQFQLDKVSRFEQVLTAESEMFGQMIEMKALDDNIIQYQQQIEHMSTVRQSDIEQLERDIEEYNQLTQLNDSLNRHQELSRQLDMFDMQTLRNDLNDVEQLNVEYALLQELQQSQDKVNRLTQELNRLDLITLETDLNQSSEIASEIEILNVLLTKTETIKDLNDDYQKACLSSDMAHKDLEDLKEKIGVCPLCGNEFTGTAHLH